MTDGPFPKNVTILYLMNSVSSSRLCWNCDGQVDSELDHCSYCGVSLENREEQDFNPPYQIETETSTQPLPSPPYAAQAQPPHREPVSEEAWDEVQQSEKVRTHAKEHKGEIWSVMAPLAMLLGGSVFFLFGLVLFLFSQDGVFTLRWDASYAAFYLVAASILLYFGWQALAQVEEPTS